MCYPLTHSISCLLLDHVLVTNLQKLLSIPLKCVKTAMSASAIHRSIRDFIVAHGMDWRQWRYRCLAIISSPDSGQCFSDSESSFVCEKFESILPIQGERIYCCPLLT